MIYLIILLTIFLFIISLMCSRNNIFSPGVITSGVWLVCLFLYLILDHSLPKHNGQFYIAISIWMVLLIFFSLVMQSCTFKGSFDAPNQLIRDIYWYISIITFPLLLLFAYKAITTGDTGSVTLDLRLAAIGQTKHFKEIYGPLYTLIWLAAYLIELMFYDKKNKYRIYILGFFYLSFAVLAMAKFILLQFLFMTLCVFYFKYVLILKHIIIVRNSLV